LVFSIFQSAKIRIICFCCFIEYVWEKGEMLQGWVIFFKMRGSSASKTGDFFDSPYCKKE